MPKNLVIVESPAKAKTIEKYMGKDYKVLASVGHVRDLPKSDFGVECNGDVNIKYEQLRLLEEGRDGHPQGCSRKPRRSGSRPTPTVRAKRSRGTLPSYSRSRPERPTG